MKQQAQAVEAVVSFVLVKKTGRIAWRGFRSVSRTPPKRKSSRHSELMMAMLAPPLRSFVCSEPEIQLYLKSSW